MQKPSLARLSGIALLLIFGIWWALASAANSGKTYPNGHYLVSASELMKRQKHEQFVIVDVRSDKDFDGKLIPGAIRMPWSEFRRSDTASNMGGLFVGTDEAQRILGKHGLVRNDMIVLYDSVAKDGGATASYLFWVLDLLGHKKMAILDRGIDGWMAAGGKVVEQPQKREPLLYQAPFKEIDLRRWVDEDFIYPRLGDRYYQILDVRSKAEYLGEKLNNGLDGSPLKAGHIPGAVNIDYKTNWVDTKSKALKSYAQLAEMYRGLNPTAGVIAYCHSARRGSFGYFVLRLLGFKDVMLYENSWMGWGRKDRYYPVEISSHAMSSGALPQVTHASKSVSKKRRDDQKTSPGSQSKGYISCGG